MSANLKRILYSKLFNFIPNLKLPKIKYANISLLISGLLCGWYYSLEGEIDIHYTPNEQNVQIINSIKSLQNNKFYSSPLLPIRFMDIIFGNVIDKGANVEYDRRIHIMEDNENIAVG